MTTHPSLTGSMSATLAEARSLRSMKDSPPARNATTAPDFVYILGEQDDYTELRYSLRSLALIPHGRVWIVGASPPGWVQNVGWIPVDQEPGYSSIWTNQRNNIYQACLSSAVSESFVLMNDDFIFLRAVWPLPVVDGGPLRSHAVWRDHPTNYTRYYGWAIEHGITDPFYFAEHRAMLMDKELMCQVHEDLGHIHNYPVPTAYGNAANLVDEAGCVQGEDATSSWTEDEWQLATFEKTFHVKRYGERIRELHPTPCVYER